MINLVTGGFGQNKLYWVLDRCPGIEKKDCRSACLVIDENSDCKDVPEKQEHIIINHLHLIIKNSGREQTLNWIEKLIGKCRKTGINLTLICDELGCGVIPLEPGDRQYREDVGRAMCELAKKADHVYRVICGIGQMIK